jgi:O-antigen/teichoic acid export membrane protein
MLRPISRKLLQGFAGQAGVYIGASALNAAIPFLLLPLIARWLGPADFGVIGSFVATVNVLILLVGLNAYGFIGVAFYREGAHTLASAVSAAVTIIAATAAVLAVLDWLAADAIARFTQVDRGWVWTLLVAAAGQAVLAVALAVAQTIRRPLVYGALQVGYGLALGVLAVLLVGGLAMGWQGRALAQAIAAAALAIAALIWLRATKRWTGFETGPMLKRALAFGAPLLPHSFAAVAMASMDRLALGQRFPTAVVGQYFLALQLASLFTTFAAALNQAWLPWLYERLARNDASAWAEIGRAFRMGGSALALGAALMMALATPLVLIVGGSAYLPAVTPLRLLGCYAALQAWYTFTSAFLFYGERTRLLSLLTVSVALVQGVLIILFVRWGANGVASALLVSALFAALVMSITARSFANQHRRVGAEAAPSLTGQQVP